MNYINTTTKKKIAIVVQRYGKKVNGGAEAHASAVAQRLANDYDITVLTSRALNHHTWEPELPQGVSIEEGINIIRFNHPRKGLQGFNAFYYILLKFFFSITSIFTKKKKKSIRRNTSLIEIKLDKLKLIKQGPYMSELPSYIEQQADYYDAFIFFTYLYYPTAMGIMKVGRKSILIPTIHDEPAVYRRIYQQVMSSPAEIFFNTDAEMNFSKKIFDLNNSRNSIVGSGIEMPEIVPDTAVLEKYGIRNPYLLYVGRIDEGKGCKDLISFYENFSKKHAVHIELVLVGKSHLKHFGNAILTGFISEEEKHQIISQALAIVIPSKYESLSLALLEGFAHGIPSLVNGYCSVLLDHIQQSEAGYSYTNSDEFEMALLDLIHDPEKRRNMGSKGKAYVEAHYNWNNIIRQYHEAIEKISSDYQNSEIEQHS